MSLLLDALKRAAQEKLEKQRQDENAADSGAASASGTEVLSLDITDMSGAGDVSDVRDLKLESGTDLRMHRADVLASELQAFMGGSPTERNATRAANEAPARVVPAETAQSTGLPPPPIAVATTTPAAAARLFRNKRSGVRSKPLLMLGGGATALLLIAIFYALYVNSLNQSNVRVDRLLAGAQAPAVAAPATDAPANTRAIEQQLLAEREIGTLPGETQAPAAPDAAASAAPAPAKASNLFAGDPQPERYTAATEDFPETPRKTATPRLRVKKNNQEPLREILLRAYNAYQSGDIAAAETGYRQALARSPQNRDALLGFAATAIQKGDYAAAMESYATLLELDPNDDLALAGISGLKQDVQGIADESLIKRLLLKRPESAQLHFALGNVYSASADWPKAQSAYFDAHRNDSRNPDYAYNLAVSLEHLRQPATALRYYRLALDLAGARKPNFDLEQARARISALQTYAGDAVTDAR